MYTIVKAPVTNHLFASLIKNTICMAQPLTFLIKMLVIK